MKIGFDFHNVLDSYQQMCDLLLHLNRTNEIHIISAIGPKRVGQVQHYVETMIGKQPNVTVHEVVFKHPRQSPQLKAELAKKLGLKIFFDDRADVCAAMNAEGILGLKVPRPETTDEDSDKDM